MSRKKTASARPANEERGEIVLVLEGAEYSLRPSYEAISAFERVTGKGLLELAQAGLTQKLTLAETAQIATECIKAWGRATEQPSVAGVNAGRVAELILESEGGFYAVLQRISGMLALATTGGYTAQGEARATGTTMIEAPVAEQQA